MKSTKVHTAIGIEFHRNNLEEYITFPDRKLLQITLQITRPNFEIQKGECKTHFGDPLLHVFSIAERKEKGVFERILCVKYFAISRKIA